MGSGVEVRVDLNLKNDRELGRPDGRKGCILG